MNDPKTPTTSLQDADDGLRFTRRFAGGLFDDMRRRGPHYLADLRDGLHPKVLAATLFLFFACLANAIAFGGLTGVVTGGEIGTVEMLVATAIGGVVFALLAGQPLTLLGGTGPIVVFTGLLYAACQQLELPFLPVYAWTGIWSGVLLIVLAVTDASALMRYFTRFTDEIFAALIAVIFIVQAADSLLEPLADTAHADRGLLTVLLGLGTFVLARGMRNFQRTVFMWRTLRNFISDFGPAIAIGLMTAFSIYESGVEIAAPAVPLEFSTTSGRNWLVPLFELPVWAILACIGPALMATILLFLDQNITTRLVNARSNRLRRGSGYHLDLIVVGGITVVMSLFALPWIVAATVHSLNHVKSLATMRTVETANGTKEVIAEVRENRLSGLAIHLLIVASLALLSWIEQIPMAVLFGLFLYMGFATLGGNQLFERVTLWVTDPKLYPQNHYTRTVAHWRIHLFTMVQVAALALLWVLKASAIGILFPILIALLVPLRQLLGRWFRSEELAALDSEEEAEEGEDLLIANARG